MERAQQSDAELSGSPAPSLERMKMNRAEVPDTKVESEKIEAEKPAEVEKARQAVMDQFAPPDLELSEAPEEPAAEMFNLETIAKHDKSVRREIAKRRAADIGRGVGLTAGALVLMGAGAVVGGAVATGVGLAAGTVAMATAFKKFAFNTWGFKPPHTHSWVMGPKHVVEQGVTESLSIINKVPKRLLPIAVLGETFNLVQNLPATRRGKKMEYQMHTHDAIVKNFQRLEQTGLADITSNEPMMRFGKPRESRLMIEKLTIGGAKPADIFKPKSYREGGVFDKTPMRTVKFNVSPRKMTLEDIKKSPQIKTLAALPEGLVDIKPSQA